MPRGPGWSRSPLAPQVVVALVAAVANCSFAVATAVGSGLAWSTSMVSELSVAGQPAAWLFQLGDALAGAGSVAVAVLLVRAHPDRAHPDRSHRERWLGALLAVFGLGTLVSAFVPLSCAPSADPACSTGDTTTADVLHDGLSILATTAALAGMWLLWWQVRRRPGGGHRHRAPARALLGVAIAACALGVAQASFVVPHLPVDAGWAQRAQIVAVSAWIVLAAATRPG